MVQIIFFKLVNLTKKIIYTFSLQNIYDSEFESTKTHITTFLHNFLEIFQTNALSSVLVYHLQRLQLRLFEMNVKRLRFRF